MWTGLTERKRNFSKGETEVFKNRLALYVPVALALIMIVGVSLAAPGQVRPSPAALIAAQRDAVVRLAYMDGVWRGPA
jgi:Zn-dependent protease